MRNSGAQRASVEPASRKSLIQQRRGVSLCETPELNTRSVFSQYPDRFSTEGGVCAFASRKLRKQNAQRFATLRAGIP
jgi:hypothetical protein